MSDEVRLTVDGKELVARRGERLLHVALDAGIDIPNLCAKRGMEPPFGACRLCWVEVEGRRRPVAACTVQVDDGMVVRTRSEAVDRLVRGSFELLMSHHRLECRVCPANHDCGLQRIALSRKLKLKPKRVPRLERKEAVDESHPLVRLDQSKCVLCGLCVWACREHGVAVLDFSRRGLDTVVGTLGGRPLAETACDGCLECVGACPVGALSARAPGEKSA